MIERFGFVHHDWWLTVTIIGVLGFVLLCLKEILREDRSHLSLRIIASFIAVSSLCLLVLKPYIQNQKPLDTSVILTEGHTHEDSLTAIYPNAHFIDWSDSISEKQLTNKVIIDGYGLPVYDLWKLDAKEVTLCRTPLPKGILKVKYEQEVRLGTKSRIYFQVNGLTGHKLVLRSFGQRSDSVMVNQGGMREVSLNYEPKTTGKFVFELLHYDQSNELINTEPLPVVVHSSRKLRILFLSGFPTFETKFLKNFMIESEHALSIRNQISTDRFKFENYNIGTREYRTITGQLLSTFDLVVLDVNQMLQLKRNELKTLESAIEQKGVGLLILVNEGDLAKKIPKWATFAYETTKEKKANLDSVIVNTAGYNLIENLNAEAIFTGQPLAVKRRYGLGLISASVITNSYQLVLEGKESDYQLIWKKLLESTARPLISNNVRLNQLSYVDEPTTFYLSSLEPTAIVRINNEVTPLKQDLLIPEHWQSIYWPKKAGWETLTIEGNTNTEQAIYVFKSGERKMEKLTNRLEKNIQFIQKEPTIEIKGIFVKTNLSYWWFYLIFLFSMAYLWIEPKLR